MWRDTSPILRTCCRDSAAPIPLKPRATKRIDEAARSLGAASGRRSQWEIRRTVECQSRSEALLRSKPRLRPATLAPQLKPRSHNVFATDCLTSKDLATTARGRSYLRGGREKRKRRGVLSRAKGVGA